MKESWRGKLRVQKEEIDVLHDEIKCMHSMIHALIEHFDIKPDE